MNKTIMLSKNPKKWKNIISYLTKYIFHKERRLKSNHNFLTVSLYIPTSQCTMLAPVSHNLAASSAPDHNFLMAHKMQVNIPHRHAYMQIHLKIDAWNDIVIKNSIKWKSNDLIFIYSWQASKYQSARSMLNHSKYVL